MTPIWVNFNKSVPLIFIYNRKIRKKRNDNMNKYILKNGQ